jgi:hypothetical protein
LAGCRLGAVGVQTFDPELGIDIEKATNGEDAHEPTGPEPRVGTNAQFTYEVANIGQLFLCDALVIDSEG